jgi:outer membrane protein TolC
MRPSRCCGARQNVDVTRQRFDAGVTDNVELVQAQVALAIAAGRASFTWFRPTR